MGWLKSARTAAVGWLYVWNLFRFSRAAACRGVLYFWACYLFFSFCSAAVFMYGFVFTVEPGK